jgi:hypothetical protein
MSKILTLSAPVFEGAEFYCSKIGSLTPTVYWPLWMLPGRIANGGSDRRLRSTWWITAGSKLPAGGADVLQLGGNCRGWGGRR